MTLLDFELKCRPTKVEKGRELFRKGFVQDLHKAEVMWVARIKIGVLRVQVDLSDITIMRTACGCEDSPYRSGYCVHNIAMFFALREKLGLPPALNSIRPRIASKDKRLTAMLDVLSDATILITDTYKADFAAIARTMIAEMDQHIIAQEYLAAASLGFSVIDGLEKMQYYLHWNYAEGSDCADEAFGLMEKWCAAPVPEDMLDNFAHDVYREALRHGGGGGTNANKNWLDVSLAAATSAARQKKFATTLDVLYRIGESTQERSISAFKLARVKKYRERLAQQSLLPGR